MQECVHAGASKQCLTAGRWVEEGLVQGEGASQARDEGVRGQGQGVGEPWCRGTKGRRGTGVYTASAGAVLVAGREERMPGGVSQRRRVCARAGLDRAGGDAAAGSAGKGQARGQPGVQRWILRSLNSRSAVAAAARGGGAAEAAAALAHRLARFHHGGPAQHGAVAGLELRAAVEQQQGGQPVAVLQWAGVEGAERRK